jgi:hypothetical protein
MISMRVVRKPRKQHTCQACKKPISGTHVYCFGGEEYGKPGAIRLCIPCALDPEETIEAIRDFAMLHVNFVNGDNP